MVSTPELLTDNSPINVGILYTQKKSSARNLNNPFLALLGVKKTNMDKQCFMVQYS